MSEAFAAKYAALLERANKVLGDRQNAERWMVEPAIGLDGRWPIELLSSAAGIELLETFLTRLEYCVYHGPVDHLWHGVGMSTARERRSCGATYDWGLLVLDVTTSKLHPAVKGLIRAGPSGFVERLNGSDVLPGGPDLPPPPEIQVFLDDRLRRSTLSGQRSAKRVSSGAPQSINCLRQILTLLLEILCISGKLSDAGQGLIPLRLANP